MKKLLSLVVSMMVAVSFSTTAFANEGEILGRVGDEVKDGFSVESPDETNIITPRVFVGNKLFTINVTSLGYDRLLTTINSDGKTILSSSGYNQIGIYPKFNVKAKVGVCYTDEEGDYVSIGATTVSPTQDSASFDIKLKSGRTHYGFVRNAQHNSNLSGSVSFVGMK